MLLLQLDIPELVARIFPASGHQISFGPEGEVQQHYPEQEDFPT